jgi:hypothetical protein
MKCPGCYKKIGPFDRACDCGWSIADTGAKPLSECGWPDCTNAAMTSVQATTKRVNLCLAHYDEFHRRQGIANAKARGLSTPEDCRAWLAEHGIKVFKPMGAGNETD